MSSSNKWAFALGALGAATLVRRAFPSFKFAGKVALITGGSRGLGLVMARQLARQGAKLAICARDATELAGAQAELVALGTGEVLAVACNVGDEAEAQIFIDQALRRYGHIDVLINNAGIIQVAPQESMGLADFQEVLAANFWGTVHASLAALPHMRERRQGRIVNITSIGGAVAVPHLLPYSCSKFAATGFSEGLTAEVARDGIQVTTILPSLMRTGSFVNALFKGRQDEEMAWFAFGSTMPGLSMAAERAAARLALRDDRPQWQAAAPGARAAAGNDRAAPLGGEPAAARARRRRPSRRGRTRLAAPAAPRRLPRPPRQPRRAPQPRGAVGAAAPRLSSRSSGAARERELAGGEPIGGAGEADIDRRDEHRAVCPRDPGDRSVVGVDARVPGRARRLREPAHRLARRRRGLARDHRGTRGAVGLRRHAQRERDGRPRRQVADRVARVRLVAQVERERAGAAGHRRPAADVELQAVDGEVDQRPAVGRAGAARETGARQQQQGGGAPHRS